MDDLRKALPSIEIGAREAKVPSSTQNKIDICDLSQWQPPNQQGGEGIDSVAPITAAPPQDGPLHEEPEEDVADDLDWHGSPRLHKNVSISREFRSRVRAGEFTSPTNGVCPGFLQCNLVVLPQGPVAFDFLLFCQRNPKACPLIEVCDVGSPFPSGVAPGADLRTDVPR